MAKKGMSMQKYLIKSIATSETDIEDIRIQDGRIVGESDFEPAGAAIIDGSGKTAVPAFADLHTHLDKALSKDRIFPEAASLLEAIRSTGRYMAEAAEDDFVERGLAAARMALAQGTVFLRSHVTLDERLGLKAWRAAKRVREACPDQTLQLVAFPADIRSADRNDAAYRLAEEALESGADAIGGCPTLAADYRKYADIIFFLAARCGVPVDLHVDESDEPSTEVLEYVARKAIETGMGKRVTVGHCTSLGAVDGKKAAEVVALVKESGMNVVTLPSCNLYLMGRNDDAKQRRGTTRIREFMDAGVNISIASDNIRDPFRPFGRADLLEEALLGAQVAQRGTKGDLRRFVEMVTAAPARAMGLEAYGLAPGCRADLVILDARTPSEALLSQAAKTHVFARGRLVAERRVEERLFF